MDASRLSAPVYKYLHDAPRLGAKNKGAKGYNEDELC